MSDHLATARKVMQAEAAGIAATAEGLDDSFARVVETLLAIRGKIIATGTGKSGHVARKVAATLASTGSPAFFVHPSDAGHGDLGMLAAGDAVLALSFSGASAELAAIRAYAAQRDIPFLLITGAPATELARAATAAVGVAVEREACPLGLAPTTSTTAMLALGDALALALMEARGRGAADFAATHPAGALGRRLLSVADVMASGDRLPQVGADATVAAAIEVMCAQRLGMTAVVGDGAPGSFGAAELEAVLAGGGDVHALRVAEAMDAAPATVAPESSLAEAARIMRAGKLATLLVVADGKLVGVLHAAAIGAS